MRPIGVHLGLGGGDEEAFAHAKELNCTAAQIFTHSPRSFQFKALDQERLKGLHAGWKRLGIAPVVSHCCYLINLGSSENKTFYGSLSTVKKELEYAAAFGCQYFVLHVGKHKDHGAEQGMAQVVKGLNSLSETLRTTKVMLLLETVAGQGTEIGDTFEELGKLLSMIDKDVRPFVGICVDTCHIFASGYDIRTKASVENVVHNMDEAFGLDTIKVIHVNDSKGDVGSRLDRHEHIGKGMIGETGLREFLNHPKLRHLPLILETPIDEEGDQKTDIEALRRILGK